MSDDESQKNWDSICGKKIYLVPLRDLKYRPAKTRDIRNYYAVKGPLAFVNVQLVDNRSEFLSKPLIEIRKTGDDYTIRITQAIAVANTVAYLSELLDPIGIFMGLSRKDLMSQALNFLLFGEGETGLMVYTILLRYWAWTPHDDVRPLIFTMSD